MNIILAFIGAIIITNIVFGSEQKLENQLTWSWKQKLTTLSIIIVVGVVLGIFVS